MYELEIPSRDITYKPGYVINTDDFVYLLEEPGGAQRLARFLSQLSASEAASLVAHTTMSLQALRRGNHELLYELSRALLNHFRSEHAEQVLKRTQSSRTRQH